jgi:hypothetical protein
MHMSIACLLWKPPIDVVGLYTFVSYHHVGWVVIYLQEVGNFQILVTKIRAKVRF